MINNLDRSMTVDNGMLAAIDAFLSTHEDIEEVLLHGSAARCTSDSFSDVDLLCASTSIETAYFETHGIFKIDAQVFPAPRLYQLMTTPTPMNNGYLLRGFAEGRIVREGKSRLRVIQIAAKRVWEEGPIPFTPEEAKQIASELQKHMNTAELAFGRGQLGLCEPGFVWSELHTTFRILFTRYHQFHSLWANSLKATLKLEDVRYAPLKDLARGFLRADTEDKALASLRLLANSCHSSLRV